ncbi:hypothetical protein PybrP1_008500 [[Pythium] brassicae (nom. inval.)]|nr:hypothetical protein PybrP1_008500 [[Pythium] brassicae (nom. inval.)]
MSATLDPPPPLAASASSGRADERLLDAYARRGTNDGASTLDMLKRLSTPQQSAGSVARHVPSAVRDEMLLQARAGLAAEQSRATGNPVANTTTLGERLGRPKERFVPGTPVTRQLRCGRLTRTDGKDDALLFASRSAPTLAHPRRILHDQLRLEAAASASAAKDALDLALSASASSITRPDPSAPEPSDAENDTRRRLATRRQKLEEELLHVTKKLNRKFAKQLFPARSLSPSKIHVLAERWNAPHESAASDGERYAMYMAGRYATQSQLDFYERDLEPRDTMNNRHRHNAAPTKYGNALVMNRNSLRGVF